MPLFDPLLDPDFECRAAAKVKELQKKGQGPAQYRGECLQKANACLQELRASYRECQDVCRKALEEWIAAVRGICEDVLRFSQGVFRGLKDPAALAALCSAQIEMTEQTTRLRSALSHFLQWEREAEQGEALLTCLAEDLVLLCSCANEGERATWESAILEIDKVTQAQQTQRNSFSLQRAAVLTFGTVELSRFQNEFSAKCDFLNEGAALSRTGVQFLLGEIERAVRELVSKLQNT